MKLLRWLYVFSLMFGFSVAAQTHAADKIGVVVLHGKWGSPEGSASGLANYLDKEGFLVTSPEMPWSGARAYDKGVEALVTEIDSAIAGLCTKGAKKIAIAGHSLGASAALYYATLRQVDGIVLVAPGGFAQGASHRENYMASIAKARRLVETDKAAEQVSFTDLNAGRTRDLRAPARSVLDYFDPEGPMNSYLNAARVKPGTAVLWIAPTQESQSLKNLSAETYEKLSSDTKPSRVDVETGHLKAPDAAKEPVSEWLKRL